MVLSSVPDPVPLGSVTFRPDPDTSYLRNYVTKLILR
jgi:hypothetical protein